jgi:signal transduction histidine kinase
MNDGFPSTDELNAKTGRTTKAAALGTPSLRRRHAPAPPRTGRAKPASELRGRMAHLLCTEPPPAVFTSAQGVAFALVGFAPAREGLDAESDAARAPSPHPEGPPPAGRADDTFEATPDSPRRLRAHNARLEARVAPADSVSTHKHETARSAELSTRERDELSALVAGELRAPLRDLVKRARRLREEQDPVALRKALRALERRARSLAETAEALSATAGRSRPD